MARFKNWNPTRPSLGLIIAFILSLNGSLRAEVIFRDNINGIEQSFSFDNLPNVGVAFYFPKDLVEKQQINALTKELQNLLEDKANVNHTESQLINITGLMSSVQFAIYAQIIEKNLVQLSASAYVRGTTENKISKPFLVWERTAIIDDPSKDLTQTSKELLRAFIVSYFNSYKSKERPIFYILTR